MEVTFSSETSVKFNRTPGSHISEELHNHVAFWLSYNTFKPTIGEVQFGFQEIQAL
jgi:hypothetical protein